MAAVVNHVEFLMFAFPKLVLWQSDFRLAEIHKVEWEWAERSLQFLLHFPEVCVEAQLHAVVCFSKEFSEGCMYFLKRLRLKLNACVPLLPLTQNAVLCIPKWEVSALWNRSSIRKWTIHSSLKHDLRVVICRRWLKCKFVIFSSFIITELLSELLLPVAC